MNKRLPIILFTIFFVLFINFFVVAWNEDDSASEIIQDDQRSGTVSEDADDIVGDLNILSMSLLWHMVLLIPIGGWSFFDVSRTEERQAYRWIPILSGLLSLGGLIVFISQIRLVPMEAPGSMIALVLLFVLLGVLWSNRQPDISSDNQPAKSLSPVIPPLPPLSPQIVDNPSSELVTQIVELKTSEFKTNVRSQTFTDVNRNVFGTISIENDPTLIKLPQKTATLTILSGPMEGAVRRIEKEWYWIGRLEDTNDLVLFGDLKVSRRHHAHIVAARGEYYLRSGDPNKTTTTTNVHFIEVGKHKDRLTGVLAHKLEHGDLFKIGASLIQFELK